MGVVVTKFMKVKKDEIPRDGLLAEYLANNNTNDTSGNGFNGIPTAITYGDDRHSNPNSAFVVNGTSSQIDIKAALSGLSTNTKGTFSVWINQTNATSGQFRPILSFGDNTINSALFLDIETTNKLRIVFFVNGVTDWLLIVDTNEFINNTWYHVAIVQNGISPIIYVDGIKVNQTFSISTDKTTWFNDNPLIDNGWISTTITGGIGNRFFNGSLDDIRLYNRDLSQSEITALANE